VKTESPIETERSKDVTTALLLSQCGVDENSSCCCWSMMIVCV